MCVRDGFDFKKSFSEARGYDLTYPPLRVGVRESKQKTKKKFLYQNISRKDRRDLKPCRNVKDLLRDFIIYEIGNNYSLLKKVSRDKKKGVSLL